MKIVFVYTGEEYLGIEYLSAVLKQNGHQTQLVYDPCLFDDYYVRNRFLSRKFNFKDTVIREIIFSSADLVAFSVNTFEYSWACYLAKSIKKITDIPIVFGGHHATCMPEEVIANNHVDFLIQGEGEYALLELVRYLEGKMDIEKIKNLYYKNDGRIYKNELRPLIEELDNLPFADKDLFYSRLPYLSHNYTIMSSRGCPYSCSYCHNSYLKKLYQNKGIYLRRRTVNSVIKELKQRKQQYQINTVMFQDEIFTMDVAWLKEFSKQYKTEIGLPYACYIHPDHIDAHIIALLRDSGCVSVNMGIESVNERVRKGLLQRFMPQAKIINAVNLLKKNSIHCRGYFIIGLPGQTEKDLIDIARFCSRYRFGTPMIFWLSYFPRTDIAEMANLKINSHAMNRQKNKAISVGYALGGNSFDVKLSKLRFLIILTTLLNEKTIEYIIKKKIYRFFPSRYQLLYIEIAKSLMRVYSFFARKKNIGNTPRIAFMPIYKKYKYFMLNKFRRKCYKFLQK
ncbi:MAG: B12-binding domain-containing radical SAM protein [Candidatus Omnitrophica bacterium]|nr:B12-binding domain-containing radical SAM protein [Candidatus Omnitrophota bacterium]